MTARPVHAAVLAAALLVSMTDCAPETMVLEPTPSSPMFIQQLASQDRSVEGINVCAALRDARDSVALADLVGTDDLDFESAYAETEDQLVTSCEVVADGNGDLGLEISLHQGTELQGAGATDPQVFPGCHQAPSAEAATGGGTSVRVTCLPFLTVDATVTRADDSVVQPGPLADLVGDVLDAVSRQG